MGHTRESLESHHSYFAAKLIDWKTSQYTIFEVLEAKNKPMPSSSEAADQTTAFTIRARNNFLSYSNFAERDVHDTAQHVTTAASVKKHFGMQYCTLEASERRLVWHVYVKRSVVELIPQGKGLKLSELLNEASPTQESKDWMFKKGFKLGAFDTVSYKRQYYGDHYKVPVTVETIAFEGEVIGSVVRKCDVESEDETCGMFLLQVNGYPEAHKDEKKKSKKRNVVSLEEYKNKFGVLSLLESKGYDLLFNALIYSPVPVPILVSLPLNPHITSHFPPLDTFFSILSLLPPV